MSDLSGAVVLVVGASGGLGSRITALLSDAGATVVTASRASGWDLRDEAAPAKLIDVVGTIHGRLDGVVIAAGVVAFGAAEEVVGEEFGELFAVNATGPIRLIQAAAPLLRQSATAGHHPFVVTLSGVVAEAPTAGMAAYSASKAALAAFVSAASRELRRAGVRLLDARPGHIETELSMHPIAGIAPKLGAGLSPDTVAERIVRAIVDDERDLPSSAFAGAR